MTVKQLREMVAIHESGMPGGVPQEEFDNYEVMIYNGELDIFEPLNSMIAFASMDTRVIPEQKKNFNNKG